MFQQIKACLHVARADENDEQCMPFRVALYPEGFWGCLQHPNRRSNAHRELMSRVVETEVRKGSLELVFETPT